MGKYLPEHISGRNEIRITLFTRHIFSAYVQGCFIGLRKDLAGTPHRSKAALTAKEWSDIPVYKQCVSSAEEPRNLCA